MATLLLFASLGFLGGLTRAVYGLYKNVGVGKKMRWKYFLVSLLVSAGIGALLGISFDVDYRVSLLAGYVGTDVLENVAKAANKGVIELGKK